MRWSGSCHGHVPTLPSRGRPYGLSMLTDISSSDAGPAPGLSTTFDLPPLPLGSLHRDPRATVPTLRVSRDSSTPLAMTVRHHDGRAARARAAGPPRAAAAA
jgi:hypothetical protein